MRFDHTNLNDQELRYLDETILDAIDKVAKEKIPYKVYLCSRPFAAYAKFDGDMKPTDGTQIYCIVGVWDEKTVMIRYSGGECDFIKVKEK